MDINILWFIFVFIYITNLEFFEGFPELPAFLQNSLWGIATLAKPASLPKSVFAWTEAPWALGSLGSYEGFSEDTGAKANGKTK